MKSDEWLSPEELNVPTDEEIDEITAGMPEIERNRFNLAVTTLLLAKTRARNKTPWRELVAQYREGEAIKIEVNVVDDSGVLRPQITYVERGYGLKGDDALMFNAVSNLTAALERIENFKPNLYLSPGVKSQAQRERARLSRRRENPDYLDIWEYVKPKLRRGELMKSITIDAVKHFEGRGEGKGFSKKKIERAIKRARENPKKLSEDT